MTTGAANVELLQAMELFREKCSICFESRCEFCFPGCEDQFCINCVQRYFKEVVDNSWGLSGCKVKCPVCYVVLPKEVWTKYADKKTLQRFEQFNRPFRPFSRHCMVCEREVVVAKSPALTPADQQRTIENILSLTRSITLENEDPFSRVHQAVMLVIGKRKTVTELYREINSILQTHQKSTRESRNEKRRKVVEVNAELLSAVLVTVISLETDNEKWRQLQHHHVKTFRKYRCEGCSTQMCFHCGEPTWHEDESCQDNLRKKLLGCSEDLSATIEWTIANGKRCPNCSVMINRDDGCNKMECLHCGFAFCWVCEGPWSFLCGFYKCGSKEGEGAEGTKVVVEVAREASTDVESSPEPPQRVPTSSPSSSKRTRPQEDAAPEIGVPNVVQIERRMSVVLQDRKILGTLQSTKMASQAVPAPSPTPGSPPQQLQRRFSKDWLLSSRDTKY